MKVVREDIDALNATVKICIERADYEKKWMADLESQRKKAHMKGFRKGKTPLGFVKKMYGPSLLAENINKILQEKISSYILEEKLETLGQPMPSDEQEDFDFDVKDLKDFTFVFDLGLAPNFEVVGADDSNSFEKMVVDLPAKMIDDELDIARRRTGEQEEVEDGIQDKDILTIKAFELNEEKERKEEGWESTFGIMAELIADDKLREHVYTLKKGEHFDFDIYNLEKDKDEAYAKKYYLHMDENNEKEVSNLFQGEIDRILRVKPAELNQEFFDKYFGKDKVKTEVEARDFVKEDLGKYFDKQSTSLLYKAIQDDLMEKNKLELPDAFLQRWLKSVNENIEEETFQKEYVKFADNLRWSLIKNKLAKAYEIEVKPEEIQENFMSKVRAYMGQYSQDEAFLAQTAQRLMQDQEQVNRVYEEISAEKVFAGVHDKVKISDKKVTVEEFNELVKVANESMQ